MESFLLSVIGIIATIVIGYGVVKLAAFIEWLRIRKMPAILKYPLIVILAIVAVVLVILIN
jgi:ABC-type antimicrobial peptide transport system permease subunit